MSMVRVHPRLPDFRRVSFKGKDRTLRTFRLPFESAYTCQSALVQCGDAPALRTLKVGFESGRLGQVRKRWWPSGKGARLSIGTRRGRLPSIEIGRAHV